MYILRFSLRVPGKLPPKENCPLARILTLILNQNDPDWGQFSGHQFKIGRVSHLKLDTKPKSEILILNCRSRGSCTNEG